MAFILKNWRFIGAGLLAVAAVGIVFSAGYNYRSKIAEKDAAVCKAEIDTLQDTVLDREADLKQCNSDKLITEGATSEYMRKISSLNRQLAEYKRLRDPKSARCIPIAR